MGDLFVHTGEIKKGSIKIGQSVNLEIDVENGVPINISNASLLLSSRNDVL